MTNHDDDGLEAKLIALHGRRKESTEGDAVRAQRAAAAESADPLARALERLTRRAGDPQDAA